MILKIALVLCGIIFVPGAVGYWVNGWMGGALGAGIALLCIGGLMWAWNSIWSDGFM